MAKTKAEVEKRIFVLSDEENPMVTLKVRKKGAGKISTGQHDDFGGDYVYDEGEVFTVRKDVADALIELDYVDQVRARKTEDAA